MTTTPAILIVDDEVTFLDSARRKLRMAGYDAVTTEADPLAALARLDGHSFDVAFLDITMPGMSGLELLERLLERSPATRCVMVTALDNIDSVMRATRLGAFDYLVKPLRPEQLVDALERALSHKRMVDLLELRQRELAGSRLEDPAAFAAILTADERLLRQLHEAELHARSRVPVLITGETGVGKELMAQAIHKASPRRKGPFVPVNMLSLSAALFESEFFGHKRGAFTGAITDKEGYLDRARGGTLFLDEIGDLPMELQGKLLRILQEGEYCPVGDTRPRQADVRFIAATHQDLERPSFRKDLYYRLRFAHIAIPALRERRDDIRLLAARFVEGSARPDARLSEEALEALVGHDWPGNVRELKGVVEAAANLAERGEIVARHLNIPLRRPARAETAGAAAGAAAGVSAGTSVGDADADALLPLAEVERRHILRVYDASGHNKTQTARLLGISAQTLHRKLAAYRVD
ncbi:MAG: sigma-54-dependent Fis family transcriptional regulator [Deltaproteobacteria bacterium]|nr:sigma-54-dependent Fis family transcriptional regulator [Deltaproteobacteria bacterium]